MEVQEYDRSVDSPLMFNRYRCSLKIKDFQYIGQEKFHSNYLPIRATILPASRFILLCISFHRVLIITLIIFT